MKVICSKCKKKYNYEDYMGICPACGYYMRSAASAAPKQRKLVTGQQKRTVIKRMFTVILMLLMAGYYISARYIRLPRDIEAAYDYQKQADPELIAGMVDEIFYINGNDFEIGGLTDFEMEGIEAPEGWRYVQVPFQVFTNDLSYYQEEALLVYLYIDGYYAAPLSEYDFPEYGQSGSVASLNLNSETFYTYFEATLSGKFVFLIPEEIAEAKFYIYQSEADPDHTKVATRLEYIYEFDMKGVE